MVRQAIVTGIGDMNFAANNWINTLSNCIFILFLCIEFDISPSDVNVLWNRVASPLKWVHGIRVTLDSPWEDHEDQFMQFQRITFD